MSMINTEEQLPALTEAEREDMKKHGISRAPTDSFRYREFRYTNLHDALAQAKRDTENRHQIGA
jgi:hypothetical protein